MYHTPSWFKQDDIIIIQSTQFSLKTNFIFFNNLLQDKFTSSTMISHQFGSATSTAQKLKFFIKDFFSKYYKSTGSGEFGHIY